MWSLKLISEKELKYFTYSFKKTTNLGKLYFLPNIHKRLSSVPSRPVISNCGTPTEKFPEYLDHILKPVTLESWPYIKDSGNILMNLKHLGQITDGAILVTADVVGLYPNIPHKAVLEILRRRLIDTSEITPGILTEDTVQITEFVLKNNFLSSMGNLKDKNQVHQLILNLHLIDDILFYMDSWNTGLDSFLNELNKFQPNLSFTMKHQRKG